MENTLLCDAGLLVQAYALHLMLLACTILLEAGMSLSSCARDLLLLEALHLSTFYSAELNG